MAEKRVVELEVKTTGADESEKSVKSLKTRLRELKQELQGLDEGSDRFKDLVREAGQLQDTIGDLNQQVKNFASDTRRLDATLEGIGAVAGAFGAVESSLALVGVESEELQQTMVKLQAAMTLVNSVQAIANALQKESALMTSISTIRTNLLTKSVVQQAVATGTATTAQKIMNTVMKANPIGLVITGIVALTGAYYGLTKMLDSTIEKEKALKEAQQKRRVEVDKELEQEIKKREARKGGLNDLQNELRLLQSKKASDKEVFEAEKKIIQERLNLLGYVQGYRGYLYREEYQQKKSLLTDLQVLENDYHNKSLEALKKNSKDVKKEREEIFYIEQEELNKLTWARQEKLDAQKQADIDFLDESSKRNQEYWKNELDKLKQANADKLAQEQALRDARLTIAQETVNGLNALGTLFINDQKKLEKFQKATALVQIGIDTAKAISSLVAASQANPLNATTFGAAGIAQFAAGIAQILTNIAKAKQILSNAGSSGNVNAGGGGSQGSSTPNQVTTPNFNLVGQSGANTLGMQTQPLQAFVVSGEVTSQQALDRNRLKNATFG